MRTNRRDLLKSLSAVGALSAMPARLFASAPKPLKILILGGTGFIGPHEINYARERGHTVTMFNRGKTAPDMFPDVERLIGDRNGQLDALKGRDWDAVIDNSGYTPDQVRLSVGLLAGSVDQYLFTSTRAVYTDFTADVMDEDAPVGPKDIPEDQWDGYGPNKVLAERIVQDGFGERTLIVRPPIIVGPGDRTDRFTYWVDRIDDGGDVMAWGDPDDPVQFIDVRDLSEFYVHLLEQQTRGIYNSEGPGSPLTSAELVYGIRSITSTPVRFTWVDWDFLIERGEVPQQSLPFWQPPRGRYLNYGRMDIRRAVDKGLTFRPLAVTARETLDWHRSRSQEQQANLRVGLDRAREAELLREWRER